VKSVNKHRATKLGKLMDYVLMYRPDEFGLVLDKEGYISIKELLQALREENGWSYLRISHIEESVCGDERVRFEISGDRIRANFGDGHSLKFHEGQVEEESGGGTSNETAWSIG